MNSMNRLRTVIRQFRIAGDFVSTEPFGNGHINDTYRVVFNQAGAPVRYLLQRINREVFKDSLALMTNIQRVTAHIRSKLGDGPDSSRRVLTPIMTRESWPCYCDEFGNHWRVYLYIEKTRTFDAVESATQAFEVARTFGCFQRLLADMPGPRLHDIIPDFHNTPKRFERLEASIKADSANRVSMAGPEIEFALAHKSITQGLLGAGLPERVTHNDTKLNNIMLDEVSGEGVCVIDLDTVMPGLALYDFGDMVRTISSPAREDERDLSKVAMQLPMFEGLARGYLSSTADFLVKAEKQLLAFSGKLITFETGIRFLSDFLDGDKYFRIHREGHNLDRCRTQFKLVESIEQQEPEMNRIVEKTCKAQA